MIQKKFLGCGGANNDNFQYTINKDRVDIDIINYKWKQNSNKTRHIAGTDVDFII